MPPFAEARPTVWRFRGRNFICFGAAVYDGAPVFLGYSTLFGASSERAPKCPEISWPARVLLEAAVRQGHRAYPATLWPDVVYSSAAIRERPLARPAMLWPDFVCLRGAICVGPAVYLTGLRPEPF